MDDFLGQIVTAVSTLSAVWMTSLFNRDKHFREKIWERKLEAYQTITTALALASFKFHKVLKTWDEGGFEDDEFERAAISEAWGEYYSAFDIMMKNRLILSREFVARMEEMPEEFRRIDDLHDFPPDLQKARADVIDAALLMLTALADVEINNPTGRMRQTIRVWLIRASSAGRQHGEAASKWLREKVRLKGGSRNTGNAS